MSPAPSPDPLAALAGRWHGREEIATTPWGPGGPATSVVEARLALGGRLLVQDYAAARDGAPWLAAHAVFSVGVTDGAPGAAYLLHWFDSLGFTPAEPAPGTWDGDALVFVRRSPRGQTRHRYTDLTATSYHLHLDTSFDGGASWMPVMRGVYTRVESAPTDEDRPAL